MRLEGALDEGEGLPLPPPRWYVCVVRGRGAYTTRSAVCLTVFMLCCIPCILRIQRARIVPRPLRTNTVEYMNTADYRYTGIQRLQYTADYSIPLVVEWYIDGLHPEQPSCLSP